MHNKTGVCILQTQNIRHVHTRTHAETKNELIFYKKKKGCVKSVDNHHCLPLLHLPSPFIDLLQYPSCVHWYNTSTNPQIRTQSQNLASIYQFPVSRTTNGGKLVLQHANTHQNGLQTQNTNSNHSPSDKKGAQFGPGVFFSKLNSNFELNFNDRLWNSDKRSEDFISKN